MQDVSGFSEAAFRARLIAQDANGQVRDIQAAQRVDGMGEQFRVLLRVVEVGDGCVDKAGSTDTRIRGNGGQALRITTNEEQLFPT